MGVFCDYCLCCVGVVFNFVMKLGGVMFGGRMGTVVKQK